MFGANSVPLWTAVAAIAASVTVLVTGIFSWFTIKLMREQITPKVIVFLRHNPEKPSLIYIIIKNVGNDLAQSLQFTPSRPIPAKAFGFDERVKTKEVMTDGPLVSGVPSLGPGEERVVLWGQYHGIAAALSDGPVILRYSYRQGSRAFKGEADLEVTSMSNTDASAAPIVDAVRHLDSISKSLKQLVSNTRPEESEEA